MLVPEVVIQRYNCLVKWVDNVVLHGGWRKGNPRVRDIEVAMIVCGVGIHDNSSMCTCTCTCMKTVSHGY